MSESTYTVKGSRVSGKGYSYNLTSKIDAERLCSTLNNYEAMASLENTTAEQFQRINTQIIQIKLSLGILQEEISTLKETLNDINNTN